ncbi:MAG: AAA family ATPase [bacterium]
MGLIYSVQIKYFRSVHTASLKQCRDLNVISGRNDAGKSNLLRGLNLFFNNQTDWQTQLEFYNDFSLQRLEQVRKESVKGKQFIQVTVQFNRPVNFKGSLPPRFTVTRTWYRDQAQYVESNNLQSLHKAKKCPSTLDTAQRFLPAFLNRIHFEYVPAVKDREFFVHLLARLQASLLNVALDDENPITPIAENLAAHIGGQVGDLQDDFFRATGLKTTIEPPTELASLFQAFRVSTPSNAGKIALSQRGDGLQARYVSSVLNYIAKSSNSFFLWGFEEPENSLEYSVADALASDFACQYCNDAQIFVTTHSPAFVALENDCVALFRAYQVEGKTHVTRLSVPLSSGTPEAELKQEIGILKIQEEVHREYSEKMKIFGSTATRVRELEDELSTHRKPLVLVEGISDAGIIETAWRKLNGNRAMTFVVRVADPLVRADGGNGGAFSVARAIESIQPEDKRKVMGLFDHDPEGLRAFGKLTKNFVAAKNAKNLKLHKNGFSFAATLGALCVCDNYVAEENLSSEFMFSEVALSERTESGGGLQFSQPKVQKLMMGQRSVEPDQKTANAIAEILGEIPERREIVGGKTIFAKEIVPNLSKVEFSNFRPLFALIKKYLVD